LIEQLSGKPVVAVTINHESIIPGYIHAVCQQVQSRVNRPVFDVLHQNVEPLIEVILPWFRRHGAA
jgi:uncharacterized NAD-dependent epimerase/dehydratase family protein